MGIQQDFANILLENLEHRARDLLRVAERLAAGHYPSEGPRLLANYLSEAAKKIGEELETLRGRPYEEIEPLALRRGQFLTILHALLEYISHANSHDVPAAIVIPIEALIRRHVPQSTIIVRFTWDFNYYFQDIAGFLRETPKYLPSLAKSVQSLPEFLPVFSFPITAKEDTLLHTVFGHEIGHFIGRVNKIQDKVPILINPALLSKIDPPYHAQILKTIQSWYSELIADLVGIRLFGPACLLAFSQVILHALNEPGLGHPMPAMRLQLMLSLLEELGFLDTVAPSGEREREGSLPPPYRSVFSSYKEFLRKYKQDPGESFYFLVAESVRAVQDNIKNEVSLMLGPQTYGATDNTPLINALADRLKHLVPPGEAYLKGQHRIPDVVSILNAGWLVYSTDHMDDIYNLLSMTNPQAKAEVKQKLNGLLSKAIESVVIRQLWVKAETPN